MTQEHTAAGQALGLYDLWANAPTGSQREIDDGCNLITASETIRTALLLLAMLQSGEAKLMRREPTEEMAWVKVSVPGQIETKNPVWARTCWENMWDAATPTPEGV